MESVYYAVGTESLNTRDQVCGSEILPRGSGFDRRSVNLRFYIVGEYVLGQVFLRLLRFTSVSSSLSMLRTHLHRHDAVARKSNRRNFQKAILFGNWGVLDRNIFHFFVLKEMLLLC